MRIEAGYNNQGKRKRKTKTITVDDNLLRTKKKLHDHINKELMKFQMEVETGEYITPGKRTLEEFVEDWRTKYAEDNLAEQTLEVYLGHLKNHILPSFGKQRLDQVKPMHIVNFLDELKKSKHLSNGTIKYIYRVFRNVMTRAHDWEVISKNPLAAVERPKEERKKINDHVYSEKEIEEIFLVMTNEPLHWQVFISLALACGF